MSNPLDDYFSSLVDAATAATGAPMDGGTMIAPDESRVGSRTATSYPTPSGTIVWCDPALVETLSHLLKATTSRPIDSTDFVSVAAASGATVLGFGNNRVLVGEVAQPEMDAAQLIVRWLDRDDEADRATLAELAAVASDDDREEAELDLEDLDPLIVGVFMGERLVAYGSSRPSEVDGRFDDIAVLTHPDHRRQGLGAFAVSQYVRHRLALDPTARMLYRCDVQNAGSNGVAESLGFALAHTIGAVRFP